MAEPVHNSLNGRLHQDLIGLVMKYQRMSDEINRKEKKKAKGQEKTVLTNDQEM